MQLDQFSFDLLFCDILQPPYFTDLPKTVIIDEEETGDLVSFMVADDQGDPTDNCMLSSEPATSGMFFINGKENLKI